MAGSATTDKNLSEFASENNISGFEFLSCIPGTIGGGLKMNSGCFQKEFKDILLSIQAINKSGKMNSLDDQLINKSFYKLNGALYLAEVEQLKIEKTFITEKTIKIEYELKLLYK